ncbi:MAG: coproporphyrinogen dehydrogenase HemZ [Clostridiales bacterium]|nr:coproporphyrinogen dehydrogenase HemZ [Clostridiales bacterium]
MENLCRVFFPHDEIKVIKGKGDCDGDKITAALVKNEDGTKVIASATLSGREYSCEFPMDIEDEKEQERLMAVALFRILTEATGYTPAWGILTGVRPSKLMITLINEYGRQGAYDYFTDKLLVSDSKTRLAMNVADAEERIIRSSSPASFSLYIGIPFCPTRCSYCSFVSHSIETPGAKRLVPDYVEKLCDEISLIGETARDLGLKLESVYFGGGTPTSLPAESIDRICSAVENSFDVRSSREYTVEAGRPDTITTERLDVLKRHGVTRISINPQTFNDDVLKNIGRAHSAQQAVDAYKLSRSMGFDNINMDLIAGLPGDTVESFMSSVDTAVELDPESITVHSLALKRSSRLVTGGERVEDGSRMSRMLEYNSDKLGQSGYFPYYMYRQSRSLGNMENVGWCRQGAECIYNVFMMEECHTVLACGAGSVTKLRAPYENHIERIFNFKYPYEYINRFQELIDRKQLIRDFYTAYKI